MGQERTFALNDLVGGRRQTGRVRQVLVIGIGAGDPEHVTVQAINALNALNRVDAFFVVDKGEAKQDLVKLREEILDRYVPESSYRVVHCRDPQRDRTAAAYACAVDTWRHRRADLYARMIRENLGKEQTGAFLVWGDPGLYDSMLGILADVRSRHEVPFDYEVIPGISSACALATRARHQPQPGRQAGADHHWPAAHPRLDGRRGQSRGHAWTPATASPNSSGRMGTFSPAPMWAPPTRSCCPANPPTWPGTSSRCVHRPGSATAGSWTPTCCTATRMLPPVRMTARDKPTSQCGSR